VFLHPNQRLTPLQEVLRYCEHRNSADDAGYVQFLSRLADPVRARLAEGASGLDYGCGPSPVLGAMFTAAGYPTESYDPFFFGDESVLGKTYDFVSCSEVLEHVHDPLACLGRLDSIVRPGGLIAFMTRFFGLDSPFPDWWYHRDPTHVCFYCAKTMEWIARAFGWQLEIPDPHIALFIKPREYP
jgi:SAM-dependent methyltransferase